MPRAPNISKHTSLLLSIMLESSAQWRHGYHLSQITGFKSGTLYPLLMRLEEQGFLASKWQDGERPGGPPRHVYRLTASGRVLARERRAALLGKLARELREAT